jgi:hypothetical protein
MAVLAGMLAACAAETATPQLDAATDRTEDSPRIAEPPNGADSAIDHAGDASGDEREAADAARADAGAPDRTPDDVAVETPDGVASDEGRPDARDLDTADDTYAASGDVRASDGAEDGASRALDQGVDRPDLPGPATDPDASEGGRAPATLDAGALDGGAGDARDEEVLGYKVDASTPADLRAADAGPLPRIWVYVMAGQSNMVGEGNDTDLAKSDLQQVPNAEIYLDSPVQMNSHMKTWLPVGPGFGWTDDQFGPELGFARRYHTLFPDRHLAIIKISQGGTELYDAWKAPSGPLYQLLTKSVVDQLAVLSTRARPEIAGFIWMQGESDGAFPAHASAYHDNLVALIRGLRLDLGVAWMPVAAGLIATDFCWPYADIIRNATTLAATEVAQMDVVETDDLPMGSDPGHYSAAGQLTLGTRFADTATSLLGTRWQYPEGYSGVQGDSNFTYQERVGTQSTPMTFDAANAVWVGAAGTFIDASGMTPGPAQKAEIAWRAPFSGTFQLSVRANVPDSQSAGTVLEVWDEEKILWGPRSIKPGTNVMTVFPKDRQQQQQVYFRTSSGPDGTTSHDTTWWGIEIRSTDVP